MIPKKLNLSWLFPTKTPKGQVISIKDQEIKNDVPKLLLDIEEKVHSIGGNFRFFEIVTEQDLEEIQIQPPAIAYVRKTGDFYFRHNPRYWFGNMEENNRWVRYSYSGKRALFRATHITELSQKCFSILAKMIALGPKGTTSADFKEIGGSSGDYYQSAYNTLYGVWNPLLLEINAKTCQEENQGVALYDIEEGDIVVEKGIYCIHNQRKNMQTVKRDFGYELKKIGIEPLREGNPGLVIQRARPKIEFTDWHSKPLNYVICRGASKGATVLSCATLPDSVAKGKYAGNGKQMINTWDGISRGGTPSAMLRIPTNTDQPTRPWAWEQEMWLTGPWEYVDIPVTNYSNIAGGTWPKIGRASCRERV